LTAGHERGPRSGPLSWRNLNLAETYLLTVAVALVKVVPEEFAAVIVLVKLPLAGELQVMDVVDSAGLAVAIDCEPPVTVPPVVVRVTEFAAPRLETTLPSLSVTATLAMKVPPLPKVVIVQV
jgi:hypothetical protein